jgi:hypothetical protein
VIPRRPRVATLILLVLHLAAIAGAPMADGMAHGHEDPHETPHLHAPDDRSCPPPHPWHCLFCRVARAPLPAAPPDALRNEDARYAAPRPVPPGLPRAVTLPAPVGPRAPPLPSVA